MRVCVYHCSKGGLDDPGILWSDQAETVEGGQVTVHLLLKAKTGSNFSAQAHPELVHNRPSYKRTNAPSVSRCVGHGETGVGGRTFPVVVSVDVESIEQLIVIVSQQVQTSGSRLDDADHLGTPPALVHPTVCLTSAFR